MVESLLDTTKEIVKVSCMPSGRSPKPSRSNLIKISNLFDNFVCFYLVLFVLAPAMEATLEQEGWLELNNV